jgi:hypothetical protein
MKFSLASLLLAGTVMSGVLAPSGPAVAQDASTLQSIEAQISKLQSELKQLQHQAAERDAELKRARADASQARSDAQKAVQHAAAPLPAPLPGVIPVPAAEQEAATPPLPPGAFHVGGVTVTLGGFAAAEGIYRSRNMASSIDTSFNSIPLANSPNYHQPEYRETAQQSRFSLLVEAQPDPDEKLTSYMETDFLSAGSSSNSNQSNSYTLRLRQFWGEYDNSAEDLQFVGGQAWSLATLYKNGLQPRHENVPLTIDAQYVVGFDWERQAQFRAIKEFDDKKISAAISIEEPQTLFSGSAGPNCLTGASAPTGNGEGSLEYTQCGGANVNSIQSYSDNYAPDVIAKVAADPGFGHYELYGLLRFLGGRVSENGGGKNYTTTGQGIGGGMILPVVPKYVDFQVSGLIGNGVGRYGTSQLPDATFSPTGKIEPIPSYSIMGGVVAHPTPKLDVYAYGGAEGADRKYYTTGKVNTGYGNPNVNLAGCEVELGSCSANTSGLVEGTVGAWWRFVQGKYGTMEAGAQYEYINRNTFSGVGATKGSTVSPSTDINAFLVSFRYLPFN